jgi:tRNA(Ile)-lysidine synthetase-like protein
MEAPTKTKLSETNVAASSELAQSKFLQEGIKYLRERALLAAGDRVLLAVSGGLDSTVLAHFFSRAARLLRIDVRIVHVDHGTRGMASEREGTWVRVLGERLQLPVEAVRLNEGAGASQADYRDARRKVIGEIAREKGYTRIATAHHADDNAETLVMRMISGTGSTGLGGMAPMSQEAGESGFAWIKPLLWASRADLEAYAREHGLAWVEDPSNARGQYLRNRVRNEILPALESLRAGAGRNLARLAARVEAEESETEAWLDAQLQRDGLGQDATVVRWGFLTKWPRALQRRLFRAWLKRLELDPQPHLVEALMDGEDVIHPQGIFLRRADLLQYSSERDFGEGWSGEAQPIEIGKRFLCGRSMAWSFLPSAPEKFRPFDMSVYLVFRQPGMEKSKALKLAWDKLPWPLVVRRKKNAEPRVERVLEAFGVPKPYWKGWPVLVSAENPDEVVALLGLHVEPAYRMEKAGRFISMECFFEDRLSPSPAT